jgi:protein SCO1/2
MKRVLLTIILVMLACGAGQIDGATTARDVQQGVGLDQHIGRTLPDTLTLVDEQGQRQRLSEMFQGKPAVLALVYFQCPNLCTLTLTSLAKSVQSLDLRPGRDFQILAVSIDPRETPALVSQKHPTASPGWRFLTGNPSQIAQLTSTVGFRYFWDSSQGQYAHPAGVVILTPQRRISQYLNGVVFPPSELRQALELAAHDRTGPLAQKLWLLCFHYDALLGRYSAEITLALRILAVVVALALATLIVRLIRTSP